MRFYKVTVTKWPIGSAIEYREPPVQGRIVTKVTDSTTRGDYRLFIVDCTDDQHQINLALPDVAELSEEQAIELAKQYQPERTVKRINRETNTEEEVTLPAVDLRQFYQAQK